MKESTKIKIRSNVISAVFHIIILIICALIIFEVPIKEKIKPLLVSIVPEVILEEILKYSEIKDVNKIVDSIEVVSEDLNKKVLKRNIESGNFSKSEVIIDLSNNIKEVVNNKAELKVRIPEIGIDTVFNNKKQYSKFLTRFMKEVPKEGDIPFAASRAKSFSKYLDIVKSENLLLGLFDYSKAGYMVIITSLDPLKFKKVSNSSIDYGYYRKGTMACLNWERYYYVNKIQGILNNKRKVDFGALLTNKFRKYVVYKQYLACNQVGLSLFDKKIARTYGVYKKTNFGSYLYFIESVDLKDGTRIFVKDEELRLIGNKNDLSVTHKST